MDIFSKQTTRTTGDFNWNISTDEIHNLLVKFDGMYAMAY